MAMIAGIICEYNPFHNGHQLQIGKLREAYGADAVVCAMSGYFMQRGEPAVVGKERRIMTALSCGADLVIELPALYATRSAYWFALGGVSLLAAAGVTHLAFGAETDDLPALEDTAARLAKPDAVYREGLRRFLKAGLPFVEAQAKALNYGDCRHFVPSLPNDRLALSYLQVIAEKALPLSPVLIPREGGAYHESALPDDRAGIASATAIRKRLAESADRYGSRKLSAAQLKAAGLSRYIPEAALPYLADTRLIFPADAAAIQLALLRRADLPTLAALPDMGEGLENRVYGAAGRVASLEDFYRLLKTRRYTMTRIQRLTTHMFIGYREDHARRIAEGPPYIRVLGANATGRRLLHQAKENGPLPLIAKTGRMKELIRRDSHAAVAWEIELRAAAMYSLISDADYAAGNPEYLFRPIML